MKVVVDIPDALLNQIREAVAQGEYEDAREFVTIALENQVELEQSSDDSSEVMTLDEAINTGQEHRSVSDATAGAPQTALGSYGPGALEQSEYDLVPTVSPPVDSRLDDGPLWGQFNRIFPVKLTLRVLANHLRNQAVHAPDQNGAGDELVPLDKFSPKAANIAREYGLKIRQADNIKDRGRGEKLSAALPVGDAPQKSKDRFRTHFVGTTDQQGDLTGAAPHLLFVNIPADPPGFIGITDSGLEFASHWNPLIDSGPNADHPLSDDEIEFYLRHVQKDLPAEFEAMALVATAISEGVNRPDSLTARVASINESWTESQASTVRTGLVSRMYELGLVRRERVGQRGIGYQLTDAGENFRTSHTIHER